MSCLRPGYKKYPYELEILSDEISPLGSQSENIELRPKGYKEDSTRKELTPDRVSTSSGHYLENYSCTTRTSKELRMSKAKDEWKLIQASTEYLVEKVGVSTRHKEKQNFHKKNLVPGKYLKETGATSTEMSSEKEKIADARARELLIRPNVFNPELGPPPPENLDKAMKYKIKKIFRVINVFDTGMISLRSHSQLEDYLLMDNILQKFYNCHENEFLNKVTRENLAGKGYYVVKLGSRFERCQFIKCIPPKEGTGFDLRIRLLDYAVPMVVPITVFRPMHLYFKYLQSQGLTAQLYDTKTDAPDRKADYEMLRREYQDEVYETLIFKVILAFPECPHILCQFISKSDK